MPADPIRHAGLALLCVLAFGLSPAAAQAPERPPMQATKWEPLPASLEALLNDGYEITQMVAGAFLLRKNSRWVVCTFREPGGLRGNPTAQSLCAALN